MDSQSDKFLQLLINNKIDILNGEKDSNFSLVSVNIDTGSLDVNDNPENYEYRNEIMKKTEKIIFIKTIVSDKNKNISQITSIWSVNET
ncbi:MAG: hypothetical protein VX812_03885 [Pseudomonadota bacterium]|nr:hypothetical protein [Pseudomonadota bacterium]